MRTLAILAFSFAVGTLAAALEPKGGWWLPAAAVLLALAVAAFFLRKRLGDKGRRALICASLAASLLYFTGYQHWVQQPVLDKCGQELPFSGVVCGEAWETDYGARVTIRLDGHPFAKAVLYGDETLLTLEPGDTVSGTARWNDAAQVADTRLTTFTSKGIYALLYARGELDVTAGSSNSLRWLPQRAGLAFQEKIRAIWDDPRTAGIISAELTGSKYDIADEDYLVMRGAGLAHLFAVSGLHCAFLVTLLALLLPRSRRRLFCGVTICVLLFYMNMVGLSPSVVRACIMQIALLLALAAAADALADSGLDTEADAKTTGVILSSGIGGLPTIEEQHTRGEEKGMEKVSPYFVPMSIANMAAAQIAIRYGMKGICTCPVTACAGGTNAVGDAFHRIRDGYETAMVCGGAESCISPLGIGGFTSMKALSTATDPDAASLPFDARRGGFVMGEGSGVLVLEELDHAKARGAKIYAEVVGYGANCDAYHFTAPAPGGAGAIDCMKLTLADAGIAPEQVDHINAHGTGTHMNDSCETAAIHAVFGEHAKQLTVVSTKSMTGHLLGGAGGVEAVFTALALRDQFAPPTIHYQQPDPECDLDYVPNVGRAQAMTYALSNSLGFGGHNACIALRRWEG